MKTGLTDEDVLLEVSRGLLRAAGLRVTSARLWVIEILRNAETPLSHAEVAQQLERRGLDRTTVYRNLVDLAEAQILRRSDFGHVFRFELIAGRGSSDAHDGVAHPHFVCTDCGKVACLPADSVWIHATRGAPSALRQPKLEIQVRGQCDACV